MRSLLAPLALVLAFPALPAAAQVRSQADLDCVTRETSPDYRARLAATITSDDEKAFDETAPQFYAAANLCAEQLGLKGKQAEAYFEYAISRISVEHFGKVMRDAAVPVEVIDTFFGFGPGKTNPIIDKIEDGRIEKLIEALMAKGVKAEAFTDAVTAAIGGYAATMGRVYAYQAQVQAYQAQVK